MLLSLCSAIPRNVTIACFQVIMSRPGAAGLDNQILFVWKITSIKSALIAFWIGSMVIKTRDLWELRWRNPSLNVFKIECKKLLDLNDFD